MLRLEMRTVQMWKHPRLNHLRGLASRKTAPKTSYLKTVGCSKVLCRTVEELKTQKTHPLKCSSVYENIEGVYAYIVKHLYLLGRTKRQAISNVVMIDRRILAYCTLAAACLKRQFLNSYTGKSCNSQT